jgi:cellulose synthase/poly-beta-1,6-N-acetylglucosamine synthase-like glycosyltransferase
LDYPKDKLKIIVVDDGSTDGTAEKVKKYLSHSQIQLIQKENGGKHTAMNLALKNIDTELIASLDADSFVDKKALKYLVKHFENKNVAAVTSAIKTIELKNF